MKILITDWSAPLSHLFFTRITGKDVGIETQSSLDQVPLSVEFVLVEMVIFSNSLQI